MEKYYEDHAWNINQAVMWFKRIGDEKHPKAEEYHQTHLNIAKGINERFKELFR